MAFAPDSRTLATADNSGTLILWNFASFIDTRDHALQIACGRSGGGLDANEWARLLADLPYEDACSPS
jgi:hypothetical protein